MKTIKKHLRLIASFLVLMMLFQNCSVYNNVPVTLDQAVQNESKVKVKTKDAESLKLNKVSIENGNYYGEKKAKGKMVKIPLDEKNIISVREQDKSASTLVTVLLVLGSIVVVVGGVYIISGIGPDLDLSWE